jgi:histidinol-phosphate/aromatic aminotransferase/cobyric acid decarboxylase-like protein/GNAT superfamily N-acetyltransferase
MRARLTLAVADEAGREAVRRLRHRVYAEELGQYEVRPDGALPDPPGVETTYIVATDGDGLAGFVGVTAPASERFSVDRFVDRARLPFPIDRSTYEIRALTVRPERRGSPLAFLLMYAALRWIEAHGGERVVSMGRSDLVDLYLRAGLRRLGVSFRAGAVGYELLGAPVTEIGARAERFRARLRRLGPTLDWRLGVSFSRPSSCFHGGAFFEAIGEGLDDLARRHRIINADVLDAWFPPAPEVLAALRRDLAWIARTSPPTHAGGLVRAIAGARGVEPASVLPGAGSSSLIFLALREWLRPSSRVLLVEPMYGEYEHLVEEVVGCRPERLVLRREEGYRLDPARLARRLAEGFDLLLWVNPNSPTGRHVPRAEAERILRQAPERTRIWIDETYVDYLGPEHSLEPVAAGSRSTVVCKSMSKAYALSGLRAAYLCGPPPLIESLRPLSPPWSVSLAAQVAAVRALGAAEYYRARWEETRTLRAELVEGLRTAGVDEIVPGVANFVLFHQPPGAPSPGSILGTCRRAGLYVREIRPRREDGSAEEPALRLAVKDRETNRRMLEILAGALSGG